MVRFGLPALVHGLKKMLQPIYVLKFSADMAGWRSRGASKDGLCEHLASEK